MLLNTQALDLARSNFGNVDINVNCAGLGVSILTFNPKKDNPEARYHSQELFQVSGKRWTWTLGSDVDVARSMWSLVFIIIILSHAPIPVSSETGQN